MGIAGDVASASWWLSQNHRPAGASRTAAVILRFDRDHVGQVREARTGQQAARHDHGMVVQSTSPGW